MPKFYDEYLHVPLLVYDGEGAGDYEELVGLLYVPPTLVEYAGCVVPESYMGYSLGSLLNGDGWERDSVIAEWGEPDGLNVCVRETEWKFIRRDEVPNYDWDWEEETLYDLEGDATETENLVDEHPEEVSRLRAVVDDHLESVDDAAHVTSEVELDAEVRDRLQQLGYRE